jgi:hypothetical protein
MGHFWVNLITICQAVLTSETFDFGQIKINTKYVTGCCVIEMLWFGAEVTYPLLGLVISF